MKSSAIKLRFGFGRKEEICKLQSYLNIHIGTINILLAEHSLEKMDIAADKAAAHDLEIRERLDGTRDIIKTINGSLATQVLALQNTQNMLSQLFAMVSGELRSSWRSLGDMVAKVLWVPNSTSCTRWYVNLHSGSQLSKHTLSYSRLKALYQAPIRVGHSSRLL